MIDCCSSSDCKSEHPRKRKCPANGIDCSEVTARTIVHHIQNAWGCRLEAQHYFYCDDPNCEIAYFGDDGSVILKSQLRTTSGWHAGPSENAVLCYCFGVTKADALDDSRIRDYVLTQTKLGLCSCETSNPSGRCCLKDFPRSSEAEQAI